MEIKQNNAICNRQHENIFTLLFNKAFQIYKQLIENMRERKPYKIIEIFKLSKVPGETLFIIQIANKNAIMQISAAQIIHEKYNLTKFNDFHAELIRQAAQGKIIEFLQTPHNNSHYKIISKKFDKNLQQYLFTLEKKNNIRFKFTAYEISMDKELLASIEVQDVYDVGYTQGMESVLKEQEALLEIRNCQ